MRILHVTTFLQGGAGRIIASLAVAQRRSGHDVMVIGDAGGEPGYETYPEYREALDANGVAFGVVDSTFRRDLGLNVQAAAQLHDAVAPRGCDVVHAHAAVPALVARLALGSTGVPIVQTMHGWGVSKTPEQALTDVMALNLADAVVTPSYAAERTLVNLGVRDALIDVIPYGLPPAGAAREIDVADLSLFAGLTDAGARVALCIGTIGERKNQQLLVDAIADPRLASLHAVFIGDGDPESLVRRARAQGVAHRVHVFGHRREADRYLAHAEMLVLPSRNEGLPLAVLEAFREGTPVVASAIPEILEAVEPDRAGYVFEPESAGSLAESLWLMLAMSQSERAAMRERMRRAFWARYQHRTMVDAYSRLYREVLDSVGAVRTA